MKSHLFQISIILLISGCTATSVSERKMKSRVLMIAEDYAVKQVKNPRKTILENGVIEIGDEMKRYYIDTSRIFLGVIDDDASQDALITLTSYEGQYLGVIEHLIMINTDKKLSLLRSFESDMKILKLEDHIITAEHPTHPRTSPLYNCSECREVVRYRFRMGELVRTD